MPLSCPRANSRLEGSDARISLSLRWTLDGFRTSSEGGGRESLPGDRVGSDRGNTESTQVVTMEAPGDGGTFLPFYK